ncbi:MAG: NAD-dependent epimerase/dehydratase family protein [Candidatus Faecousia sp.]|nr:NAD-dependent epimerase/dehydratase family protein [Oscillospiraceae bacterium]MDY2557856.1 NAD-dependent epimerase/dehydratase family protein [Candidatus Faecousia sp.]
MKKILITGKGSYLGNSLKAYLEAFGDCYQVDCLSLRSGDWKEQSFRGYDAVYHTAAIVHQPRSKDAPGELARYRAVNCDLAVDAAKKAKAEGVRQFVFLSTMAVYGLTAAFGKTVTITAQTPTVPTDNYGLSKLEAERALLSLEGPDFRVSILRPPMIYGKDCKGNFRSLVSMARRLPFFPKVPNRRSMLYVGSLNRLVQQIIDREDRGIFCPQDPEYLNTSAMVQAIAAAQGKRLLLIPGFSWALHLLRHLTGAVDKAFGSLVYDKALSKLEEDYCIASFPDSVKQSV